MANNNFFLHFTFFFLSLFQLSLATGTYLNVTSTMTYEVIRGEGYEVSFLSEGVGPESLAFGCSGEGPYIGISDGRIMKYDHPNKAWNEFAFTSPNRSRACDGSTDPEMEPVCGRPLGLKFNTVTCDLYIADAYYGLCMVGPEGGLAQQLATTADGIPFHLTNAVDIDSDTGEVYFTDSSKHYQRRNFTEILMKQDRSGRFLKYDPDNGATVLLDGLFFPNGVALSKDKSFIIVVLTYDRQLAKFWLSGPKAGSVELFAQLLRFPDNIKLNEDGDFWVAFNSGRGGQPPRLEVPEYGTSAENTLPLFMRDVVAAKFKSDGSLVKLLDGMYEVPLDTVTEVLEHNGTLWIGSLVKPYVIKLN